MKKIQKIVEDCHKIMLQILILLSFYFKINLEDGNVHLGQ
jgi:hypothetical protein